MLNRNDIYSIIKRILKYFVFLTIIFMFKQCKASAMTWQENGVMPNMCSAYDITGGASNPCLYISGVYRVHFQSYDASSALYEFKSYVDIPNSKHYKYINFNILNINSNLDNYTQYPDAQYGYENSKILVQIYLDDNTWMNCENNGGADYYCPTNGKGIKRLSAKFFRLSGVASNSWFIFQSTYSWYASENNEIVIEQQQTNTTLTDIQEQQEQQNEFMNSTDMTAADNEIDGFLQGGLSNLFKIDDSLQQIVNLPVQLFNSLTSACTPIQLNIPFINEIATIPCPDAIYNKILGSALKNLLKIVVNGFICYRLLLVILGLVQNMTNPDDSKLEVVDL